MPKGAKLGTLGNCASSVMRPPAVTVSKVASRAGETLTGCRVSKIRAGSPPPSCRPAGRGWTGPGAARLQRHDRARDLRRQRRETQEAEKGAAKLRRNAIEAVKDRFGDPGQQLDNRDAGVGRIVVRPLGSQQRDLPARLIDELIKGAAVKGGKEQHQDAASKSLIWWLPGAGNRSEGRSITSAARLVPRSQPSRVRLNTPGTAARTRATPER